MLRYGTSPYLECSSKGDKRFSAFYARPKSLRGKSIEEAYQAAKVFADGSTGLGWREAKGKKAVNREEVQTLYRSWWREYVSQECLLPVLRSATGLSDIFGQAGSICQAQVLWEIRESKPTMTPNTEQQDIIDFGEFLDESLMVSARAGTGKTTTLLELVAKLKGVTWFCAFAKRIAVEVEARAKAMRRIDQDRVRFSTVHAAGNRIWVRAVGRCDIQKFKVGNIVDDIATRNPVFRFNKWRIVRLVELAKQSGFGVLNSLHDNEAWLHIISHFGLDIDAEAEGKGRDWDPLIAAAIEVYELSLKQCKEGVIDFSDMLLAPLYYKVRCPRYDNILIDEAQDISPLRLRLIMDSLKPGGRIIAVGDECQPQETKVAVVIKKADRGGREVTKNKSIDEVRVGDVVVSYNPSDCSFIRNRRIVGVTARPYDGELIKVECHKRSTKYTPNHWCLASFSALRSKYAAYLMRKGRKFRIGKAKMDYGSVVAGPMARMRAEGGDAMWLLSMHDCKEEAFVQEQVLSANYGIPQIMFSVKNNSAITQEVLNELWDGIHCNVEQAIRLLKDFHRDIDYPLVTNGHTINGLKRPIIVRACNLMDGCLVLPYTGETHSKKGDWEEIRVSYERYRGSVYSLSVEGEKTYCADGIITHNCQAIYGFTGSDDQSMKTIQAMTGADTLPLTMSYRCPKSAIKRAQRWVPDIEAHDQALPGVEQTVGLNSTPDLQQITFWETGPFSADDVILCRNNRPLAGLAHQMIRHKIPCYVEGRDIGQGLIKLAKQWPEARNLTQLESKVEEWREAEVEKYRRLKQNYKAEFAEDQADTLLTLMDYARAEGRNSIRAVIEIIDGMFADTLDGGKPNCITLSSIHKAKGKEWDRVFLLGRERYMPSKWARQPWEIQQERNLQYVADTRNIKEFIEIVVGVKDFSR